MFILKYLNIYQEAPLAESSKKEKVRVNYDDKVIINSMGSSTDELNTKLEKDLIEKKEKFDKQREEKLITKWLVDKKLKKEERKIERSKLIF